MPLALCTLNGMNTPAYSAYVCGLKYTFPLTYNHNKAEGFIWAQPRDQDSPSWRETPLGLLRDAVSVVVLWLAW